MACQLEFHELPSQTKAPRVTDLSAKEAQIAGAEVQKLLDKGVITKTTHDVDEFISTIFTSPKTSWVSSSHFEFKKAQRLAYCLSSL